MTLPELAAAAHRALAQDADKDGFLLRPRIEGGEWHIVMQALGPVSQVAPKAAAHVRKMLVDHAIENKDKVLFAQLVEGSSNIWMRDSWLGVRELLIGAPWRLPPAQVRIIYCGAIFAWDDDAFDALIKNDYVLPEKLELKILANWFKNVVWSNDQDRAAKVLARRTAWSAVRMRQELKQDGRGRASAHLKVVGL